VTDGSDFSALRFSVLRRLSPIRSDSNDANVIIIADRMEMVIFNYIEQVDQLKIATNMAVVYLREYLIFILIQLRMSNYAVWNYLIKAVRQFLSFIDKM